MGLGGPVCAGRVMITGPLRPRVGFENGRCPTFFTSTLPRLRFEMDLV